jgi:hypothetical protein
MNNFVKLLEVKQNASLLKRLREEEMKEVNGGTTCATKEPFVQDYGIVTDYGIVDPYDPVGTTIKDPIVQDYGVVPPDGY